MRKTFGARILALALVCALLAVLPAVAAAEGDRWDYIADVDADGNICYTFDEVIVTLPADWMGKYYMEIGDDYVSFYQATGYLLYQYTYGYSGGLLFSVGYSENTDYRNLPSYDELGPGAEGYYFLVYPTDYQAYMEDESVRREFDQMQKGVEFVTANSYSFIFHTDPVTPAETDVQTGGKVSASSGAVSAVDDELEGNIAFTEAAAGFRGTWVPFRDGFQIYLPSEWVYYVLDDQETAKGVLYHAGNDGRDSLVGAARMDVVVCYNEAGQLRTLGDLEAKLSANYTGVQKIGINGIPCVTYESAQGDYRGVAFFHPSNPNYVFTVSVSPFGANDQNVSDVGSAILCSLSRYVG